jgi:DNA-binding NtrC family response regulator
MSSVFKPILILVDDHNLRQQIINILFDERIPFILAESLQDAKYTLKKTLVSCIVVTDNLALSYDQETGGLFQGLSDTIPTVTLIRPSRNALELFDQIRYPPYDIHEYLTLPCSVQGIVHKIRSVVAAATPESG